MKPVALALFLCLCACSSVSLSGLARLYALSPMETDPSDIAVALTLPEGLALRPGTAVFGIRSGTKDGTKSSNESYILAPSPGPDGSTVYQIAERDWNKVRAQQKLVADWEAEDPRGHSGSISVSLEGCTVGDGPADDATLSIAMRTTPDGDFFTLVNEAPWGEAASKGGLESIKPCSSAT